MQHHLNKYDQFFVREHDYYYTPHKYNIEFYLRQRNLDTRNTHVCQELARFFYHRMIEDKEYVDEFYTDELLSDEYEINKKEFKTNFYNSLWDQYVPGYTPTEKALNLLSFFKREAKKKGKDESKLEEMMGKPQEPGQPDPSGKSGPPQPVVEDTSYEEVFNFIPDEEQFESMTMNKLMDQRREISDFDKRMDMLNQVSLVEGFGKSFEIKKTVAEERCDNSEIFAIQRMMNYGELVNAQIHQLILPNFDVKLVTKDLFVKTPIRREVSKQKIIIMVDYSGSMNQHYKQEWVLSILADRLSYCMKEECEIFFSHFLTLRELADSGTPLDSTYNRGGKFPFIHIYDEATAIQFFKTYSTDPSGGDTEIGKIINVVRDEIMDNKRLFNLDIDLSQEQPEILVINDGQDSVKTDNLTWKTNAITLYDGRNTELQDLCVKTEGKYIFINGDGPDNMQ